MVWTIKGITLLIFFGWIWTVYRMISLGKRADALRSIHPTAHQLYAPTVNWMTAAMTATAALSHILIRQKIGGADGPLFTVHLWFAVTFCIALCLMQLNPGTTRPILHRWIAYAILIPSFIGTAVTGPILLILM